MPSIDLNLDGDNAWPDLKGRKGDPFIYEVPKDSPLQMATFPSGMKSGRASAMIRVDLPDGKVILIETSVACFLTAAAAMRGRFGENG